MSTDVTSSVRVGFTGRFPDSGDAYLKALPSEAFNTDLKDFFFQGRYVNPGAITVAAGVATILAGSIFFQRYGVEMIKVEVLANLTIQMPGSTNNLLVLYMARDSRGILHVIIDAVAVQPTGSLLLGTASGGPPFSTITESATLDKAGFHKEYLNLSIPDFHGAAAFSRYIIAPMGGKITKIWVVQNGVLSVQSVITPKINGTAITGGAVTVPTGAKGQLTTVVPTGLNLVNFAQPIEFAFDGAPTTGIAGDLMAEITTTDG